MESGRAGKRRTRWQDPESGCGTWFFDPGSTRIPGGSESVQTAQQLAAEALRDVALSISGEPVLVSGHKHVNALLMCALLKDPLTRFRSHIVEETLPPPFLPTPSSGYMVGSVRAMVVGSSSANECNRRSAAL